MLTVVAVAAPLWREDATVSGRTPSGGVRVDTVAEARAPVTAVLATTTHVQHA
jgi:hypothetical protein